MLLSGWNVSTIITKSGSILNAVKVILDTTLALGKHIVINSKLHNVHINSTNIWDGSFPSIVAPMITVPITKAVALRKYNSLFTCIDRFYTLDEKMASTC